MRMHLHYLKSHILARFDTDSLQEEPQNARENKKLPELVQKRPKAGSSIAIVTTKVVAKGSRLTKMEDVRCNPSMVILTYDSHAEPCKTAHKRVCMHCEG